MALASCHQAARSRSTMAADSDGVSDVTQIIYPYSATDLWMLMGLSGRFSGNVPNNALITVTRSEDTYMCIPMVLEVAKALITSNSEKSEKVLRDSRYEVPLNCAKDFGSLIGSDCNVAWVKT